MRQRTVLLLLLTLVALPLGFSGCKKGKTKITPDSGNTAPAVETPSTASRPPVEVEEPVFKGEQIDKDDIDKGDLGFDPSSMRTVYFAFDSYELTPSSVATLRQNADQLKSNSNANILVEGHADERGSVEYNLALGEKRARAVRDYLTSLGIDASRVRITTYGKEKPAIPGHDESAYSKNRRAEFVPER